jgi:hypothetical protein
MAFTFLKHFLPDRPILLPILYGPFRGARIRMNPRHSLRKMAGLYEHELNSWMAKILPKVTTVLDVGANDGYFTFGCAAAFQRQKQNATIVAFEPQTEHIHQLETTLKEQSFPFVHITLRQCLAGNTTGPGLMTLNEIEPGIGSALIKIDVEGAEIDVVNGASHWLKPTNFFLIEVHREEYLQQLQSQFASSGITLQQVNQRPLPFLGRERRDDANWWLVSQLA